MKSMRNSNTFIPPSCKYENLEKEYACATNISSCIDPLEKENANLKVQLEVLTSKHVKM
jgi:hypothetical protein